MNKTALTFGGWYQRTTLHLSEIYSLLALGHSKLPLGKNKLVEFHQKLNLKKVGEKVVIVTDDESNSVLGANDARQKKNWQLWVDYFFATR